MRLILGNIIVGNIIIPGVYLVCITIAWESDTSIIWVPHEDDASRPHSVPRDNDVTPTKM